MSGVVLLILRAVMVLALYAFLVYALILLWRELRQHAAVLTRSIPALVIQVAGQPQAPQTFQGPQVLIGRDPNCDLQLASETVSSRHAQLRYHHEQWWLEDLASTNGTFLNLAAVQIPTVIVPGDQIRCGEVEFLILNEVQPA